MFSPVIFKFCSHHFKTLYLNGGSYDFLNVAAVETLSRTVGKRTPLFLNESLNVESYFSLFETVSHIPCTQICVWFLPKILSLKIQRRSCEGIFCILHTCQVSRWLSYFLHILIKTKFTTRNTMVLWRNPLSASDRILPSNKHQHSKKYSGTVVYKSKNDAKCNSKKHSNLVNYN